VNELVGEWVIEGKDGSREQRAKGIEQP
jgi:hypothetical protein